MSSIKNLEATNMVPYDIAQKLGNDGINIIIETLWLAYHSLKKNYKFRSNTHENKITQEWGLHITDIWYNENRASRVRIRLSPINQYEDDTSMINNRKSPQIDFCFRSWNDVSYFGIECKNLYNRKPQKKRRYVEKGVNHFVSGYYASQSSVSAMVGYVLTGSVAETVRDLTPIIERLAFLIMNLTRDLLSEDPQYKSIHLRTTDNTEILLYHLFFDLVA